MKLTMTVKSIVCFLLINFGLAGTANAFGLAANCQISGTRSRIAVKASGLSGSYLASVVSGDVIITSIAKPTTSLGVVSFIFDSNPIAISKGATEIPANFIKNKYVIVRLRQAVTYRLLGAVGPTCTAF